MSLLDVKEMFRIKLGLIYFNTLSQLFIKDKGLKRQ